MMVFTGEERVFTVETFPWFDLILDLVVLDLAVAVIWMCVRLIAVLVVVVVLLSLAS